MKRLFYETCSSFHFCLFYSLLFHQPGSLLFFSSKHITQLVGVSWNESFFMFILLPAKNNLVCYMKQKRLSEVQIKKWFQDFSTWAYFSVVSNHTFCSIQWCSKLFHIFQTRLWHSQCFIICSWEMLCSLRRNTGQHPCHPGKSGNCSFDDKFLFKLVQSLLGWWSTNGESAESVDWNICSWPISEVASGWMRTVLRVVAPVTRTTAVRKCSAQSSTASRYI